MKNLIIVGSLILAVVSIIIATSLYHAPLLPPTDSNQDETKPPTSPTAVGQLRVNNLAAFENGTVSLDVTLYDGDSGTIQAVIINGTSYTWSEGSSENNTILNGQTKSWSTNIDELTAGATIEVTLQSSSENATRTTTVTPPPSPGTPDTPDEPRIPNQPHYIYDYHAGVGLFERGVYFIATSQDPTTQLPRSDLPKSYWELMRDNITVQATEKDFISILISRGNFPTGGYGIQIETFTHQEAYPVKFRFQVNITDPGQGVAVTQAFTNPLVLVPIGNLPPGTYEAEVHISWYTYTFDDQGKPVYKPVMTFKEEVWTQLITITDT